MKVAELIVKILENEGITHAFGIPGAGINPVYKYLNTSKEITHFTMRHEEAAVHAADAYFRASGKLAVAICTSGPGATNFVTGLYTANIDSIPLIALTGQNVTALLGKDAFQCVDIAEIARTVSKATWCITKAEDVPRIMREAFKIAKEGKPGPVVIDLPLDIQNTEIDYNPATYAPYALKTFEPDMAKIREAINILDDAASPVLIMGGGVILADAARECVEFAEYMQIPVITTYMAKGGIPVNHPLNAEHMGIQVGATRVGNKVFMDSDVVLGIGCRFSDRHTGNLGIYSGNRKFIHIDIEPKQIGKIIKTELGIVADAKLALKALIQASKAKGPQRPASERVKNLPGLRASVKTDLNYQQEKIKPHRVYHEINNFFGDNTIFTTGCGLNQIWSGQFQEINSPRMYLPSGGAGTLGFDIPAAFGAAIAQPGKKAVAIMGDFGFTFMVEELAVAAKYSVPIIVIIINNSCLSLIRQNQKYAYNYEYAVEMKENTTVMDYVMVSKGFGCNAERVIRPEDIRSAFGRAIKSDKPYVIDIFVEEETDCSMGISIDAIRLFEKKPVHEN
jgi:tartronate-semialdehyde synthase